MAMVIVNLKVMPEGPEVSFKSIEKEIKQKITEFGGELARVENHPIGFGLEAFHFIFVIDESKSNLDPLESSIKEIEGVMSTDVVDVRRTIG